MSNAKTIDATRRALFVKGGATLGAALATGSAAAAVLHEPAPQAQQQLAELERRLQALEDRDALRALQAAFAALLEQQAYAAIPALFTVQGRLELPGISAKNDASLAALLVTRYGQQQAAQIPLKFEPASAAQEQLHVAEDRQRATAQFHGRVLLSVPLTASATIAAMARLQGLSASTQWQRGYFAVEFGREGEQWRIASLQFRVA